jgi:thioredoxin reductase/bacterioferritin-associated ferredoxin
MSSGFDLAIIGAGPAGLAAAVTASGCGLSVVVLDDQGAPGGQIYRSIESMAMNRSDTFRACGPDYADGLDLVRAFRACASVYRPLTSVWRIDEDGTVYFSQGDRSGTVNAQCVLIATGAIERPVAIPGWTLPGVMSCGAAQILFKSADLAPSGRTILAGGGPLLFLYAWQLFRRGIKVDGIVESTPLSNYIGAAIQLPGALAARAYLAKGLRMMRDLRQAGIPIWRGASGLRAVGWERVEQLDYTIRGRVRAMPVDTLLLHEGVVPHVNLAFSTECEKIWDPVQHCFRPALDASGETSHSGIYVAGDSAGIGGAKAAQYAGVLTAYAIAQRVKKISAADKEQACAGVKIQLDRHARARPFLDRLYRPAESVFNPPDPATIVCRCEEITVGQIRTLAAQGCVGPNQMKAFVRCGMGPCQGRLCGLTVAEIMADTRGVPVEEIGYYHIRSPVKPVTLGELALLNKEAPEPWKTE